MPAVLEILKSGDTLVVPREFIRLFHEVSLVVEATIPAEHMPVSGCMVYGRGHRVWNVCSEVSQQSSSKKDSTDCAVGEPFGRMKELVALSVKLNLCAVIIALDLFCGEPKLRDCIVLMVTV